MADAVLAAAADAGIRITLLDTLYLHGGLDDAGAPPAGLARPAPLRGPDVDTWAARHRRLTPGPLARIGHGRPLRPRRRSGCARRTCPGCCRRTSPCTPTSPSSPPRTPRSPRRTGRSPLAVLADAGLVTDRFTAVHATHLTDDDVALLAGARATACICPTTEADLADGIGPVRRLADRHVALALGTDQHVRIDPFEELQRLEADQRLASGERGRLSPGALLAAATRSGYRALGWPDGGAIEAGAPCDLVAVAPASPAHGGRAAGAAAPRRIRRRRDRRGRRRRPRRHRRPPPPRRRRRACSPPRSPHLQEDRRMTTTLIDRIGLLVRNADDDGLPDELPGRRGRGRGRPDRLARPRGRRARRRRADRRRRPLRDPRLRRQPHPPRLRGRPLGRVRGPDGRPRLHGRRHPHDRRRDPRRDRRAAARPRRRARRRGAAPGHDDDRDQERLRPHRRGRGPGAAPRRDPHARDDPPRRPRRAARVRGRPGRLRRPRRRADARRPARRTPAGSTSSATAAPSPSSRPSGSSSPAATPGSGCACTPRSSRPRPRCRSGVELGAASVDHCTHLEPEDVDALAGSGTVATLLPGAEFSTRSPYPDARRLLDAGVDGRARERLQPGLLVHDLDAVLHRRRGPGHGDDARARPSARRPRAVLRRCGATTSACSASAPAPTSCCSTPRPTSTWPTARACRSSTASCPPDPARIRPRRSCVPRACIRAQDPRRTGSSPRARHIRMHAGRQRPRERRRARHLAVPGPSCLKIRSGGCSRPAGRGRPVRRRTRRAGSPRASGSRSR